MLIPTAVNALKSSRSISWLPIGRLQQTLARCLELSGISLHSGKVSKVKLCPEFAGRGRYFDFKSNFIPASIDYAEESPLCTTLSKDGFKIRTVEHLLSAMEAMGVDNCRIEIANEDDKDSEVEVPIFDGSAGKWVDAIEEIGLKLAIDQCGNCCEKMAPYVNQPVHVWRNDCYLVAFPASAVRITYGIDFPQVPDIGCQWFSTAPLDNMFYAEQIAPSRTFCIYEEIEQMRNMGLIKGGSIENALVCRKPYYMMWIVWSSSFIGWTTLDAIDSSRGIIILWCTLDYTIHEVITGIFSISVHISLTNGFSFWLSAMYGPSDNCYHLEYWQELDDLAGLGGDGCIIGGDFNVTC